MKKLFIILLSLSATIYASAQSYDRDHDYDRRPGHDVVYRDYHGEGRDRRIYEINREFDQKIWAVKNDYRLSNHQKRRMIRDLNHEREMRIREARRWH